jgi:hypothetical protein
MTNATEAIGFTVGDRGYTMVLDINALCDLEEALGRPAGQVLSGLSDPATADIRTMRAVFWAGLRKQHNDLTLTGAGELLTAIGFAAGMEVIQRAILRTFPPRSEAAAQG